jgi:hypothetical protein
MRIPSFLLRRLDRWARERVHGRDPDFVIGGLDDPYMLRWWVLPRNRWFNIYLHRILRSDDDRALHDHPWPNASIVVRGRYVEHTIQAGGVHHMTLRGAGDVVGRGPRAAHRLEVLPGDPAMTIFVTGPILRHWGFHCPEAGWRHWKDFVGMDKGSVGRGCGEMDTPPRRGGLRFLQREKA